MDKGQADKLLGNVKKKIRGSRAVPAVHHGRKALSAKTKRISSALFHAKPEGRLTSSFDERQYLGRPPSLFVSDHSNIEAASSAVPSVEDEAIKYTPPIARRPSPSIAQLGTLGIAELCDQMSIEEWKKRIQTAIVTDSQNMLQEYLKGFNMDYDVDFTFLHLAVFNRKDGCARKLLRHGVRVNAVDDVKKTPLHYATINNNPSMICLLLKNGAKADVLDDEDMTPIMHAAHLGLDYCLRELLIGSSRKEIHICNKEGKAGIHYAAQNDDVGCLKMILRHCTPSDINVQDGNYETPLHLACLGKHTRNVQCLLESGANPFIQSKDNLMAVHYSACLWDTSTLKVMLGSQDIDINVQDKSGKTLLHLAVASNPTHGEGSRAQYDCVEYLLEFDGLEIDLWDVTKTSALGYAAEHDSSLTNLLLQAGAEVNGQDERLTKDYKINYVPPLHRAVEANQPDNVLVLVQHGAAVNMRDSFGRTPLHIATEKEFEKCMKILLQNSANTNVKDKHDQSPMEIAIENNNPSLVQTILQHAMHQVPSIWSGSEKAFKINLGCLLPSDQSPETQLLKRINDTFREESKREIFLLPVTRTYIDLKMKCLNHLEIFSTLLTLMFLLLAMAFLFSYANCLFKTTAIKRDAEECSSLESSSFMWWYMWMSVVPIYTLYKLVECVSGIKECFTKIETYLDMSLIMASYFLSPWTLLSYEGQKLVVVTVIIFSGLYLMLALGSVFTFWDIQMMMFRKVFHNVFIILLQFGPLLFCFIYAIHAVLQEEKEHENLYYSFVASLTYASGGIQALTSPEDNKVTMSVIRILFIILIIAVMMNLLTGVAVNVADGLGRYGLYRALQRKLLCINQKEAMLAMFRLVKSRPFSLERKLGPEVCIKVAEKPLKHLDILSQFWYKCCVYSGSFGAREIWPLSWVGLSKSDIQSVDEVSRRAKRSVQVIPKSRFSMTFVEDDGSAQSLQATTHGDMDSIGQNISQLQKKMVQLETMLIKIQGQLEQNVRTSLQ